MIHYQKNAKLIQEELIHLYDSVAWSNYSNNAKMLEQSWKHSLLNYVAYDNKKPVGLIRLVGDGYSIIFIQDILVRPEYQRQGIGTHLIQLALREYPNYYQIHLVTDDTEKTKKFYESIGFKALSDLGCIGFTYLGGRN